MSALGSTNHYLSAGNGRKVVFMRPAYKFQTDVQVILDKVRIEHKCRFAFSIVTVIKHIIILIYIMKLCIIRLYFKFNLHFFVTTITPRVDDNLSHFTFTDDVYRKRRRASLVFGIMGEGALVPVDGVFWL